MPISTTNLRARLSCDELHQLRWLLGLGLALLAYWTLLDLQIGSFTGVICAILIVISCLAFPALPGRIPPWAWRWAVPAGILFIVGDFIMSNYDILPVLVRMISLLTLFRCLQYRRRREDLQLALLCLFIIVLTGVLTLSLLFGLQILLFAVLAMALLFVVNLLEREASRALTIEDWRNFSWRHFMSRLARALDLRLLLMSAGLFTFLAALSTLIFVAIPRYTIGQAFSISGLKGRSGFSDEILYGLNNSLTLDNSVVLRVDVPAGVLFTSPPYWRMIVFDKYAENTFSTSDPLKKQPFPAKKTASYNFNDPSRLADGPRPPGVWTFYLEGNQSRYLPVLGPVGNVTFSTAQDFQGGPWLEQMYLTDAPSANVLGYEIDNMDMGGEIPATDNEIGKFTKLTHAELNAAPDSYPYTLLQDLPTNPDDLKILQDTVNEIRGDNGNLTAAEFSERVIQYLKVNHQAANELSVSLNTGKDRDKLVAWLNSNSTGWCEYFAGSFVLLARAAGYPARVVAGFKGATYNTIEDYYVVRNSGAHAWAEIFDGKDRWLREDPTPAAPFFPGLALPPGASSAVKGGVGTGASNVATILSEQGWAARVDSLRMLWYRRVINFDQADQQEFAGKITDLWQNFADSIKQWFISFWESVVDWLTAPLSFGHLMVIIPLLLACVLGLSLRFSLHNWWLLSSGSGLFPFFGRQAPVRRDAGRWLVRFLPVWRARSPLLPPDERLQWDHVRFNLLALRYGPLDNLPPDPAGICRRARDLLRQARRAYRRPAVK